LGRTERASRTPIHAAPNRLRPRRARVCRDRLREHSLRGEPGGKPTPAGSEHARRRQAREGVQPVQSQVSRLQGDRTLLERVPKVHVRGGHGHARLLPPLNPRDRTRYRQVIVVMPELVLQRQEVGVLLPGGVQS
jgi:hypothetical protein